VGRPLSQAPPTKAVLPFVCTSHRSPAFASDQWLAPTKAENPGFEQLHITQSRGTRWSAQFFHSNAEPHLPAPQRLDPQDSRMDQTLQIIAAAEACREEQNLANTR